MLLALGPLPPADVRNWVRFARRVVCELRLDPGDLAGVVDADSLDGWSDLLDSWDAAAVASEDTFRWTDDSIDAEVCAYLLYAMDRVVSSNDVQSRLTPGEAREHAPFTMLVVKSFADGLCSVGTCQSHLVAQVMASLDERMSISVDILA